MKKFLALTLTLALVLSLFAGCMGAGGKLPSENAGTTAAAEKEPASPADTQTAAPTEPASTEPGPATEPATEPAPSEPADADGAQLLKAAAEKMAALESLGFQMNLTEEVASEGISLAITVNADGAYTAVPEATYTKGSMSLMGWDMPMEEYSFLEDGKKITYSWDDTEEIFLRTEEEPEEAGETAEPQEPDYDALELTTVREGGEYVVTVNANTEEAAALIRVAMGFLAGSESVDMLPDLDDTEGIEELADVRFPLVFRIDAATGYLTGFDLDLTGMFEAMMAAVPEAEEGSIQGRLELRYRDFNSVAPITAPENYKDYEEDDVDWGSIDWGDLIDGDSDADASGEPDGN